MSLPLSLSQEFVSPDFTSVAHICFVFNEGGIKNDRCNPSVMLCILAIRILTSHIVVVTVRASGEFKFQ